MPGDGAEKLAVAIQRSVRPPAVLECQRPREKRVDAGQGLVLLEGRGPQNVFEPVVRNVIGDASTLRGCPGEKARYARTAARAAVRAVCRGIESKEGRSGRRPLAAIHCVTGVWHLHGQVAQRYVVKACVPGDAQGAARDAAGAYQAIGIRG